jgi:phage-related protein
VSKEIIWVGSSLEDLQDLPKDVRLGIGHALRVAQDGGKDSSAKPMKGKDYGASVLEIVENFDTDTYRCVYTVKFEEALYVLHSYQKKSTHGIKTSQRDIEIIEARFKQAEKRHKEWLESQKSQTEQTHKFKKSERK